MKEKMPGARVCGPVFSSRGGRGGRTQALAVWKQIEECLVAEVLGGKYPPGKRLPTESELSSRFGVGRHTLRQAMAALEAKGVVRIEQGRGTFVHEHVFHYQLSEQSRFREHLQQQGREPHYAVVYAEVAEPSAELKHALDLLPNSMVVHLLVDCFCGPALLANSELFFDRGRFPDAAQILNHERSVCAMYRHYGIDQYGRRGTIIRSRLPTAAEARRLHQPKSCPIFVIKKIDVTVDNRPIGYSETKWCSDRVEFFVGANEGLEKLASSTSRKKVTSAKELKQSTKANLAPPRRRR